MPKITDASGNIVQELPYTEEGMDEAQGIINANPALNIDYAPGGQFDAMSRMETNFAGEGKTGYNQIGVKPMLPKPPIKSTY